MVLLSVAFFINPWLGGSLTLIWLARIYSLKIKHLFWINLLFAIGIALIFSLNLVQLKHQTLPTTQNQHYLVRVQPDEVNVNGNQVSGKGYLPQKHESVLLYGFIKSQNQLGALKKINRTTDWQLNADASPNSQPTNFNQFNADRYYRSQKITNSLKINQIQSVSAANWRLTDWIHDFRYQLLIRAQHLPHYLKTYTLSLILGETNQEMSPELSGIKQLGLIHLFSISGFHVYYLISLLEFVLVYLRVKREHYRLIIMLILPIYYIFAGASVGLLRSVLMVEIGMVGRCLHHQRSALDVWSLALIFNLILAPESLVQFGSQLSYVLSFALIYTNQYSFWKQTIFMNLVSFPFIIYNIYSWHFLTIAANLLILPLFSILVFPVVILGSIGDHFCGLIGQLASGFIYYFDVIVNLISDLPGNVDFGKPNFVFVLVAFLLTLKLIDRPKIRWMLLITGIYVVAFLLIHFPVNGEVAYFDVGQGDSFLVREPFNRSVTIIDTGGKLNFGNASKSSPNYQSLRTSINYLNSVGISTVDNLCISHQDADHCGDLPAFLQKMRVRRLLIPLGMNRNQRFMARIRPYLGRTQLIQVKNGMSVPDSPLKVLHPFTPGMGTNADSMVLFGRMGDQNWLFTGDLDAPGELDVIHHYPNLRVNVLKLGHHGSKTASSPQFLDQIKPQFAIISAGRHNRYHHPDPEVVRRVKRRHIHIFNTQKNGMIVYYYHRSTGHWVLDRGNY